MADDRPVVTHSRATASDIRVEPDWEQGYSLTVGNDPARADIAGVDEKAIQAAVDMAAARGGGTVHIEPGTYRLRNAVHLRSNVAIVGSGSQTLLIKEPSVSTRLTADFDWYEQEITVADATGLRVGDGVVLQARSRLSGQTNVSRHTLVGRLGNRFKLDRPPKKDFWLSGDPTVSSLFSLLDGDQVGQIRIENLVLDGNRDATDHLDGNYAGCIFLQDCRDLLIRGVEARNNNGDGISWQIAHDVVVEDCHVHHNRDLGLHPGSGSQRPLVRNNRVEHNDVGIFLCWGVRYALVEGNSCQASGSVGISIGHRDTDNVIRDNDIANSGQRGVLFRRERGRDYAPHRNVLEANRIVDSGAEDGIGVEVEGETEEVVIRGNRIAERRDPGRRIGVCLGPETRGIVVADNSIDGFAVAIDDQRVPAVENSHSSGPGSGAGPPE